MVRHRIAFIDLFVMSYLARVGEARGIDVVRDLGFTRDGIIYSLNKLTVLGYLEYNEEKGTYKVTMEAIKLLGMLKKEFEIAVEKARERMNSMSSITYS